LRDTKNRFPIDTKKAVFAEADERSRYPLDVHKLRLGPVASARVRRRVGVGGGRERGKGVKEAFANAVSGGKEAVDAENVRKGAWHGGGAVFARNALLAAKDNSVYSKVHHFLMRGVFFLKNCNILQHTVRAHAHMHMHVWLAVC